MLIGIVKKNAIMMIDFALKYEKEHKKSPEEATKFFQHGYGVFFMTNTDS